MISKTMFLKLEILINHYILYASFEKKKWQFFGSKWYSQNTSFFKFNLLHYLLIFYKKFWKFNTPVLIIYLTWKQWKNFKNSKKRLNNNLYLKSNTLVANTFDWKNLQINFHLRGFFIKNLFYPTYSSYYVTSRQCWSFLVSNVQTEYSVPMRIDRVKPCSGPYTVVLNLKTITVV